MRAILAVVVALLTPLPLAAQMVAGTLLEGASGRPVPGAFMRLLDLDGKQVRAALTDAAGRFVLEAPAAGRYRIRAEQLGYASTLSPILTLADEQILAYTMTAEFEPIMLDAIDVETGRRCIVRPDVGAQTARLWEEVRKALAVAAWAEAQALFRFEYVVYERTLDAGDLSIQDQQRWTLSGYLKQPFVSSPADELARDGYIRHAGSDYDFFAPDAAVLLSDPFLDTHCFRIRPGGAGAETLVGLEFEPVPHRHLPEITGVLWVDQQSLELRHLEFHYTGGPEWTTDPSVGGRVDFRRLPNGAWIVERWWIRMPAGIRRSGRGFKLVRLKEAGGEVRGIRLPDSVVVTGPPPAAVEGVLYDSLRAAPFAGATVFLSGTSYATTTDAAGHFRLDGLPAGTYRLAYAHPRREATGVRTEPRILTLTPGRSDTVMLATPSRATLIGALCPEWDGRPDTGHVVGMVRESATGRPVAGAELRFSYRTLGSGAPGIREPWIGVTSDAYGHYRACGLPAGVRITLRVSAAGRHATDSFTLARGELVVRRVDVR